jgi:hypothetical protein
MKSAEQLLKDNLLVKHYAGSHAYGTALPTSDTDFRGIFCADPINLLTPFFPVREVTDVNEEDTKYYELAHFMKLCLDCNPNIVESLWVDPQDIVDLSSAYTYLRRHRKEFLSSKIAFSTTGYATAQIKRIKGHNKWINSPQEVKAPEQKDFVSLVQWYGNEKVMPRDFKMEKVYSYAHLVSYGGDIFGVYSHIDRQTYNLEDGALKTQYDEEEKHELGVPVCIIKFNRNEWRQAKDTWKNYWTWKENRNKARNELEEDFGYDTKHGMHCVRLMRMGLEALRDGEIIVKRPDAKELLSIRNGAWSYEEMVEYAEYMDNEIRHVWYKKTDLPKKPDIKFASKVLMEVQEMVWNK